MILMHEAMSHDILQYTVPELRFSKILGGNGIPSQAALQA